MSLHLRLLCWFLSTPWPVCMCVGTHVIMHIRTYFFCCDCFLLDFFAHTWCIFWSTSFTIIVSTFIIVTDVENDVNMCFEKCHEKGMYNDEISRVLFLLIYIYQFMYLGLVKRIFDKVGIFCLLLSWWLARWSYVTGALSCPSVMCIVC